jgi:FADH2 O2-dependent halogenase
VVVDKEDFQKSGADPDQFFDSLVQRSRQFSYVMQDAERIRPYWMEGDYSYKVDRYAGPGWMLIGDALRFVDPIFSSGVDVALFSALYAYEAMVEAWRTGNEAASFDAYHHRINDGVDLWYETISMFYRLQNLLSRFAMHRIWRPYLIQTLQGNPYIPERARRSRQLLTAMQEAYERVLAQPGSVLRPWAMDPEKDHTLTCPICLGVADYVVAEKAFVCRRCEARTPMEDFRRLSSSRS